ncbi:MAG: hypothetical protein WDM70_03485 [Nitrosomonadales bacterium]
MTTESAHNEIGLTVRQMDCAAKLASGLSNKDIGKQSAWRKAPSKFMLPQFFKPCG